MPSRPPSEISKMYPLTTSDPRPTLTESSPRVPNPLQKPPKRNGESPYRWFTDPYSPVSQDFIPPVGGEGRPSQVIDKGTLKVMAHGW